MSIIKKIHNDLNNRECEGFFMEADGNSLTVRRVNDWQFDVTTESYKGHTNTFYKQSAHRVEEMAQDFLAIDDRGCYIPHYPVTKWSDERVEKFIKGLCPRMCDPFFRGFTLTAKDQPTFTVNKHANGMEWLVNGSVTDFGGVLRMTRLKLSENANWEYSKL